VTQQLRGSSERSVRRMRFSDMTRRGSQTLRTRSTPTSDTNSPLTFRRAYDSTLLDAPIPKPTYDYGAFYETRRRRGPKATYAWESRRTAPSSSSSSQHSHSQTQSHPHSYHYHRPEPSPFFHPGQKPPPGSGQKDPMAEHDHVAGVSSFWRAIQVSGLIAVVIAVGGALGK